MLRAAVALILALALAGCGGSVADVARDEAGRPTEAGSVRADRLRAGDCFDDQDDQSPDEFPVVPCDDPHDNEVVALLTVRGDGYPGQEALTEEAATRCREAFRTAVGEAVEGSGYGIFYVLPSQETWERDDDRTIICALFDDDLEPLRGSKAFSSR